ncbi:hypothetical protein GH714_005387 [Hevea brasiliensis]|uniref:Protein kinase domain-containing protein n=1 Tax=Hevea brasiliensis TaxID=3981 RepID=A0A6A6KXX7_HEVBR|nr:hypothetical protein GH714_005387 [Hevea brasiliensis]
MAEFDYQDLVKATEGFSPSRLIGKGSHGSVYKGILLQENKVLAIKKSSIGIDHVSNDNSKKLDNEIFILSSLRDQSPYIINFLGTSHDSAAAASEEKIISRKLLVMEFMPNGSLHEMLHVAQTPPSWPKRVEIALQIARAVQSLHESKPLVSTGRTSSLLMFCSTQIGMLKNQLKALKEKAKEPPAREPESDSTSGKSFIDAGAFRKRSHINGERQYVCHYEGCGKKFLDSSKLKRHILIDTGERDFVCPHEGRGFAIGYTCWPELLLLHIVILYA